MFQGLFMLRYAFLFARQDYHYFYFFGLYDFLYSIGSLLECFGHDQIIKEDDERVLQLFSQNIPSI